VRPAFAWTLSLSGAVPPILLLVRTAERQASARPCRLCARAVADVGAGARGGPTTSLIACYHSTTIVAVDEMPLCAAPGRPCRKTICRAQTFLRVPATSERSADRILDRRCACILIDLFVFLVDRSQHGRMEQPRSGRWGRTRAKGRRDKQARTPPAVGCVPPSGAFAGFAVVRADDASAGKQQWRSVCVSAIWVLRARLSLTSAEVKGKGEKGQEPPPRCSTLQLLACARILTLTCPIAVLGMFTVKLTHGSRLRIVFFY
jgi:hypothetical protein